MCNFANFTYLAFCQISPYLGPSYEASVEDNGFIFVFFCRSNLVASITPKNFCKELYNDKKQQHNLAGSGIFPVDFCCIFTGSNNRRFHGNE